MNSQIRKCKNCEIYTLEPKCPRCGLEPTISPHPPKFSPDDKYLRFRLEERYKGENAASQKVNEVEKEDGAK